MVVRGNLAEDGWTAFFVRDTRVTGAFALDRGEDIAVARELVAAGASLPDAVLGDPEADLFEALEDVS
jgi:3-phenylpropionate/trans-cinnamate dioxygenase ferredoxin reductase subunit